MVRELCAAAAAFVLVGCGGSDHPASSQGDAVDVSPARAQADPARQPAPSASVVAAPAADGPCHPIAAKNLALLTKLGISDAQSFSSIFDLCASAPFDRPADPQRGVWALELDPSTAVKDTVLEGAWRPAFIQPGRVVRGELERFKEGIHPQDDTHDNGLSAMQMPYRFDYDGDGRDELLLCLELGAPTRAATRRWVKPCS
jgi:hypothetical protein